MKRELAGEEKLTRREALKTWMLRLGLGIGALAVLLSGRKASAGWGACQVSGCYCKAFEGNSWHCEYCGHRFQDHW